MTNTKALEQSAFDALLYAAAARVAADEAESFLSLDVTDIKADPKTRRKVLAFAKYGTFAAWKIRLRVSLVACLILISMLFTACMCIPSVRSAIWDTVIELYEKCIVIKYKPTETADPPMVIEQKARLTYLPEGYYSETWPEEPEWIDIIFYNSDGEYKFAFTQQTMLSEDCMLNYEDGDILSEVEINGHKGMLIEYPDDAQEYIITWTDGIYKYYLSGTFSSQDELFAVAKGVILE